MALNLKQFDQLKQWITASPMQFDAEESIELVGNGNMITSFVGYIAIQQVGDAQKAWELYVKKDPKLGTSQWGKAKEIAMTSLGITDRRHSDLLFFLGLWCDPYYDDYCNRRVQIENLLRDYFWSIDPVSGKEIRKGLAEVLWGETELSSEQTTAKNKILRLKKEVAKIGCDRLDHFIAKQQ
ncbi:MAG: hypothetical protein WBB28_02165 [Crinalium sp.]